MPPAPRRTMVVLEDSLLLSMATQPAFQSAFPFLSSLAAGLRQKPRAKCSRCGHQSRTPQRQQLLHSAKLAFANMGADGKRQLKQLLNAQQVRIYYRQNGSNRPVQITF